MVATGGFRQKRHLESLEQELEDGIPSAWASMRVRRQWDLASNLVEGFFVASDGACACDTPRASPCRGDEVSSCLLAPREAEWVQGNYQVVKSAIFFHDARPLSLVILLMYHCAHRLCVFLYSGWWFLVVDFKYFTCSGRRNQSFF